MTNPDLFRQIVFQVVRYDTEFLVLGIVDMKTRSLNVYPGKQLPIVRRILVIPRWEQALNTEYVFSAINATASSSLKISGTTPSGVWVKNRSK